MSDVSLLFRVMSSHKNSSFRVLDWTDALGDVPSLELWHLTIVSDIWKLMLELLRTRVHI
jgi:hypothetical protein